MKQTRLVSVGVLSVVLCITYTATGKTVGVPGDSYRVPGLQDNFNYLNVFGPDARREMGRDDTIQVIFFRFPTSSSGKVEIAIFDPDAGRSNDQGSSQSSCPTQVKIIGGKGAFSAPESRAIEPEDNQPGVVLTEQTFDRDYDNEWYGFGPYNLSDGEVMGDYSYFKVVVHGLSGAQNNSFRLAATPASCEAFSYNWSFNLNRMPGAVMRLWVEVPAGASKVDFWSYDLDPNGGTMTLRSPGQTHILEGSGTGRWNNKVLDVMPGDDGIRWELEIVKGTQTVANASFAAKDGKGNPLALFATGERMEPKVVVVPPTPVPPVPPVECRTFAFDAGKSYDPDDDNLEFFWDFGDGATSSDIKVVHTYLGPGVYEVTLTVNDYRGGQCSTSKTKQTVKVNAPPTAGAVIPEKGCVGETIVFDGSSSTDAPGDALDYKWDFGDGSTGEGEKVGHSFDKPGTYKVVLTVTDDSGTPCDTDVAEGTITINSPPTANAGEDQVVCIKPGEKTAVASLDASGSSDEGNDKISYRWDFGDGTEGEGVRVSHAYPRPGTYVVTLKVTDDSGTMCNSDTDKMQVTVNAPPIAVAIVPKRGCAGETLKFDGSASTDTPNDQLTYEWNFGDGNTAEGPSVSHSYSAGGDYAVTLTVKDNSGTLCDSDVVESTVKINSEPTADAGENVIVAEADPDAELWVAFDGSASKDGEGDELAYLWDFGDGTQGKGAKVRHNYRSGGLYNVTLTVTDNSGTPCNKSTDKVSVMLNRAPKAVAGKDRDICTSEKITLHAYESYDKDGDPLTYTWDLGDGTTAEGRVFTHTYEKGGSYTVVLTVDDGKGQEVSVSADSISVRVNSGPTADIKGPAVACTGDTVSYDGSGSSDPEGDTLTYRWDFGDGTAASGVKVTHVYQRGGEYQVRLTVDDGSGLSCSQANAASPIKLNSPPVAVAGHDVICCAGDSNQLDAGGSYDPDGDELTYLWDFGDGNTSTEKKPVHVYEKGGKYTVSLTVTDSTDTLCNMDKDSFTVDVNEIPVPVIAVEMVE